jgi:hypothetical protein
LVGLTHWIKRQKKATTNPIFNKTKENNWYSRLILNILFKKWFLLFEVPSLRTKTLEKPLSLINQK